MDEKDKKYYTSGKFAETANVTQRTIRYYDKIGLLKPSKIEENGYRKYSDEDFLKLQKIISLKQLGFSIDEIFPLVLNENKDTLKESFRMQIELISKHIAHLENLKWSLHNISKSIDNNHPAWEKVIELIRLTSQDDSIAEQYKNAINLNTRISLHDQYSVNPQGWFSWLYQNMELKKAMRILELGCGNGRLWDHTAFDIRNREVFLSDISDGMIEEVKKIYGKQFNCLAINAERIPFKDGYFQVVIANHVLFYLSDLTKGLSEIYRVLTPDGTLYCSTYGKDHMKEINDLVAEFDPHIRLSQIKLYERFGLENGVEILNPYFSNCCIKDYQDTLKVNDVQPLIDYILSCHGNQNELLANRIYDFRKFLQIKMDEKGYIEITKQAGLIIAKK